MPDHVHALAQIEPERAARVFSAVLAAFRRRTLAFASSPEAPRTGWEWERIPRPEKVQYDKRHIARTIRYIHLNPCRASLCSDPFEWEWSTHRDWTGAAAYPVVNLGSWSRSMGWSARTCAQRLHAYVCTDPIVPQTSALPDADRFLAHGLCDASLSDIAAAVSIVTRSGCSTCREFGPAERRLSVLSASRWTRYRAPELAQWLDCHPTTVRRILREADGRAGEQASDRAAHEGRSALSSAEAYALAMVLADHRLRTPVAMLNRSETERFSSGIRKLDQKGSVSDHSGAQSA